MFKDYREEIELIEEKKILDSLPHLCKVTILDFVFRNSNPAVFGVKVEGGELVKGERFINASDEKIGQVKEIQEDKQSVGNVEEGKEAAISVPGVNFERQLHVGDDLYTNLSETEFRTFKQHKHLLSAHEKAVLMGIAQIKRKRNETWGV